MKRPGHKLRGFTLIEMLIAIVVLAAGVTGIFAAFSQTAGKSADPMIRQQAISIAQAYLEEAILKPYDDPDGGETGTCEEGARIQYDDVADYNCINDVGAVDQYGNIFAGLGAYNIVVNVSLASIGAASITTRRVVVTVTHATGSSVTMTGYRAAYY